MPGRTIAIGDIHGCSKALASVLAVINPQPSDKIVTLGDYIDRGPDSRGAIDQLLDLRRRVWLIPLMGNHDRVLLGILAGKEHTMANWLALGGTPTLKSFDCHTPEMIPERYVAFLRTCCRSYESERHLFVHANYLPNLHLEEQPQYVIRWESLRVRCPAPHISGKTAILGHTSQKTGEILDLGHLKCIDTYCYGGGWLTAIDVESGEIWQANQNGELRNHALLDEKSPLA
jgi:serine/threonine protein phosphatase 1